MASRVQEIATEYKNRILYRPALALSRVGVTANAMSYFGVFSMSLCAYFMTLHSPFALIFIPMSMLADLTDGVIARIQKSVSIYGRVIDIVCDNLSFAVFMMGVALTGYAPLYVSLLLVACVALSAYINTVRSFREADRTRVSRDQMTGFWVIPNLAKISGYIAFIIGFIGDVNFFTILVPLLIFIVVGDIAFRGFKLLLS